MVLNREKLINALKRVTDELDSLMQESSHWRGELSVSALSTATAVTALILYDKEKHRSRIERGLSWLTETQNDDGGWGDSVENKSNISTSFLVYAAFSAAGRKDDPILESTKEYLERNGGIPAVIRRYGEDRTFSAPILTNLAIAGVADWAECPPLPFHLAVLPRWMFRFLGLSVVSYALPALIGIGIAQFKNGKGCSVSGIVKRCALNPALKLLHRITPESGGYLEATPITAFVAMSLIASGFAGNPVVTQNIDFLCSEQCENGAWKIEKDLSVWLTSMTVNALGSAEPETEKWLLNVQTRTRHPYVGSDPGGWGWTDSSGSVPDADDTSGALLALSLFKHESQHDVIKQAEGGIRWLLSIQNSDGGFPTFCKGWQKLPFDKSGADLTAHALRALSAWQNNDLIQPSLRHRMDNAVRAGFQFLKTSQRDDGSWLPLWFGNEHVPNEENPVYGTACVLKAYRDTEKGGDDAALKGIDFLMKNQNTDGSWGGTGGVLGSVEETALACDALCGLNDTAVSEDLLEKGFYWLCNEIEYNRLKKAVPIGLYFAKLWYSEGMYPIVFSASALKRGISMFPELQE